MALGIGLPVILIGLFWWTGWYKVTGLHVNSAVALRYTLLLLVSAIAESVLLCWVLRGFQTITSIVLSAGAAAGVFGALHWFNPHASFSSCLAVAVVVGLPCCALFVYTRSLWATVGFHWAWNVVLTVVFGVTVAGWPRYGVIDASLQGPDVFTGGAYGPEAGLVAVVLNGGVSGVLLYRAVTPGGSECLPKHE